MNCRKLTRLTKNTFFSGFAPTILTNGPVLVRTCPGTALSTVVLKKIMCLTDIQQRVDHRPKKQKTDLRDHQLQTEKNRQQERDPGSILGQTALVYT